MNWFTRLFPWWRVERDPVAEQLREIERRGRGVAGLAHLSAFLVLVVFSLGSLVGLTGDALAQLISQWQTSHTPNVPASIAIAVSTLLVFAMDIGMVYAARIIQVLQQRKQTISWVHIAVISGVALVEAASYIYMSWLYDHPATFLAWAIIAARGIAAPLLAAYLSLAGTPPIGERDILYAVERVTAHGVITEMTQLAGATGAPLDRKLALYRASTRSLDDLISAEAQTRNGGAIGLPDPRQGIAALPTTYLAPPVSPVSPPAPQLAPPVTGGDPDDDGPGGGMDSTGDEWDTAEFPAVSAFMNGHQPHRSSAWPPDRAEDDAERTLQTVGRKRGTLSATERKLLKDAKQDARLAVLRQMQEDADAEDVKLTVHAIRKRFSEEELGTNDTEVRRLLGKLRQGGNLRRFPARDMRAAVGATGE